MGSFDLRRRGRISKSRGPLQTGERDDSLGVQFTTEMLAACERLAAKYKVAPDLHEQDLLLKHIMAKVGHNGLEAYFGGGHRSALAVRSFVERRFAGTNGLKILEFASGYGRVTRHLRSLLPQQRLVASDIHPAACRFISEKIGIETHCSSTDPAKLEVGDEYDLIVVQSLFTHLPPRTFGPWLTALYSKLKIGGYLIVTTHGIASIDKFPIHAKGYSPRRGFGYRTLSDQNDLNPRDYGTMVVSPYYVTRTVAHAIPTARIVAFESGSFFSQDEWIIQRYPTDPIAARSRWTKLGRMRAAWDRWARSHRLS